jgi:hypothetical protein
MTRQFGPDGVAYFTGYPLALRAIWTINVVGGLVAACLLLTLSRRSVPAEVTSAAAQAVLLAVTFGFRNRWAALGAATSWFDFGIGIGVVTVLLAGCCAGDCFVGRRPISALGIGGHGPLPHRSPWPPPRR